MTGVTSSGLLLGPVGPCIRIKLEHVGDTAVEPTRVLWLGDGRIALARFTGNARRWLDRRLVVAVRKVLGRALKVPR